MLDVRGGAGGDDYGYAGDYGGGRDYEDDDYSRGPYGASRGDGAKRYDYDEPYGRRGDEGERRYGDDFYSDDNDRNYSPASNKFNSLKSKKLPDVGGLLRNGNKKIGTMLLGGGAVFTLLGISLFFNKTLMRLGNLLFIFGVPLFIGPGRTAGYFLQPKKARATGCLGFGIFLVLVGWPIFGIALEVFGIMNLFGNMFPVAMILLKQMPFVGKLMKGDNSGGRKAKNKRKDSYEDSYRYEDEDDRYGNDDGYRQEDSRYY